MLLDVYKNMEAFNLNFQGKVYRIEPALHDGFYSVASGDASGLLLKDDEGQWVFSLETSESLSVEANDLAIAIEKALKETSK
jgi:hypothetical protein